MRKEHKYTYKDLEITYSVYGENEKYSATADVRIKSEGLTLMLFLDKSLVQSDPKVAESKLLDLIRTAIDAYIP